MSYNFDQTPSGSSRPSTISEYVKHGKPIALTTPIPEEDVLHITSKAVHPSSLVPEDRCLQPHWYVCCLLSYHSRLLTFFTGGSSELELKSRSSVEDIRYFDQQPQNHALARKSSFIWYFHKLGSLDCTFASKSLSNLKEQFSDSLPEGAPKHRVAGRGGSGSRLRKKSSSNSAVSSPNVPHPPSSSPTASEPNISRRPFEFSFWHRATGRGGAGSFTRPRTVSKSPIPILGFLHGRKQSESQLTEQRKPQHGTHPWTSIIKFQTTLLQYQVCYDSVFLAFEWIFFSRPFWQFENDVGRDIPLSFSSFLYIGRTRPLGSTKPRPWW